MRRPCEIARDGVRKLQRLSPTLERVTNWEMHEWQACGPRFGFTISLAAAQASARDFFYFSAKRRCRLPSPYAPSHAVDVRNDATKFRNFPKYRAPKSRKDFSLAVGGGTKS